MLFLIIVLVLILSTSGFHDTPNDVVNLLYTSSVKKEQDEPKLEREEDVSGERSIVLDASSLLDEINE